MPGRLEGKNAIVTGASRGIGAGIARRLAAEGANVAITARTVDAHPTLPGSLNETLAALRELGPGKHLAIAADLASGDDRARIVPEARAALGPIDILVNNAAAAIYQSLLDYPLKRRRLMLEVNLLAPIDLAQAVIPEMRARGAGWIVNVSSATARHNGPPFRTETISTTTGFYGATKAALNRATNALAAELCTAGIRVNTVEPRAGVLSPGAEVLAGDVLTDDLLEPLESMVEAVLALCTCGPERTGRVHSSLDLIAELGRTVMALDGRAPYAPAPLRRGAAAKRSTPQ
jgi:NAD(P)-dependent dehydrogenase (short-subunit alcohol dehydrogenase family)